MFKDYNLGCSNMASECAKTCWAHLNQVIIIFFKSNITKHALIFSNYVFLLFARHLKLFNTVYMDFYFLS